MAYRTTSWKNTDIGKIPSDWNLVKLGEHCKMFSGGTPSVGETEYYCGDIPFIRSGEIHDSKTELTITEVGLRSSSAKLVKKGDILYALYGATSGDVSLSNIEGAINQAILCIRPDKILLSKYLVDFLCKEKGNIVNTYLQGGQGNLSGQIVKNIILSIPQMPEQQKIAAVLTDLDDLIAELEKARDKKQAIKIGAMQELLTGKRRLPGFNKPWKEVELGELLTYEQPQNYIVRSEEYRKTGTPVLTAGKTFVLGYTDEIDNIFSSVPVIIFDDFTTVSKFVNFPFKVKSSAIKILKLKNIEDNLKFIFEVMQITPFNLLNHQRYWISKYSKMSIKVPEYIEQTTIANILSDMDDEISAINDKINKYKQIKAGVADELLSGRIRLIKPQE